MMGFDYAWLSLQRRNQVTMDTSFFVNHYMHAIILDFHVCSICSQFLQYMAFGFGNSKWQYIVIQCLIAYHLNQWKHEWW